MIRFRALPLFAVILFSLAAPAWSNFVPPRNLDPANSTIQLDSTFQQDAWLVYTYDIDHTGSVINATIQSSNGVVAVEQAVLAQIRSMRFEPASRSGMPVKVSADPVVYTWILDKPRIMSAAFADKYREAWALYSEENYDGAFDIAAELKNYPGRNALEEVKFQILAASLASRWKDEAAELQHLTRVVEFQNLAIDNNFKNRYMPTDQYLQVLNRVVTLQLNRGMLADAGGTLDDMQQLGRGSDAVNDAARRYSESLSSLQNVADITVRGELLPLFRDGPGSLKIGLSRSRFSISDVRGRVGGVFLVCGTSEMPLRYPSQEPWTIPTGWSDCVIDVTGRAGTSLVLHQLN
ncbi:energy transducer TonB [Halioglobus maricola]|uniref:Energy transducer TonB n=1 Tax=Halioglobus maricola TaxID=2601894 RepID=A0A5P9NKZ0_9GAMM|nr:energy transducer TonB [Halioglobus maricola]QFU76412.1 energy transducer TonB [Halioglobus maricola]